MEEIEKKREDYIRVTSVLYPFSGLAALDANVVANAARRGTKVHKICEGIMQGLGEIGTDEEVQPYIDSFMLWWKDGYKIVEMEKRFWCDEAEVTGQVDMIIETEEGLCIVDIKTSSKESPTWEVQGSAYYYLAKRAGYDIKKVYFLHLKKTGKAPKLIEYPAVPDFFLQVLRVFRHFYKE